MDIVCGETYFYKNPEKLPLNKLFLQYDNVKKNGKTELSVLEMLKKIENPPDKYGSNYSAKAERKPAIDKCWMNHNRRYVTFHPFHVQFDEKENSQFLEKNRDYLECIQFFVSCTFQQFWCYVSYEPRFATIVINFLENALPPRAVEYLSTKYLSLYNEIYSCIYKIYRRLITFFVSETEFIEEDAAINILRKSKLISSPVIMNFCYLFMHCQKEYVETLVNFCYSSRFKHVYLSELPALWDEISDDLDQLCIRSKLGSFNSMYVEETASYFLEAAESILSFVSVCKPAIDVALEQQFPHRLPHIYQKIYTDLYDMYDMKSNNWSKLDELITRWLALGRQCFINLSHTFIEYCLKRILEFRDQQREQEEYLEIYLALVSTSLDDEFFIRDYNEIYPIEKQFQILIDNIPNFDKSQTEYLLESLSAITAKFPKKRAPAIASDLVENKEESFLHVLYESVYTTLKQAVPGPEQPENVVNALKEFEQLKLQWEGDSAYLKLEEIPDTSFDRFEDWQNFNKPSDNIILQRIAAVKEMLPDLDRDYILRQLECADYKPELVIARVLDERTSKSLESIKMVAHVGKKPQLEDARDLLDVKNDDIKHLVLKASYNYEDDDDFDDRNDIVNAFEPDKDDSKLYRHLKQNNLEYDVISDPSSTEDEGVASGEVKQRDAFCEDPEIVRARRSAQRGRVFKPLERNADVVGRAKGQGQDNSVQHNRDKKNVHKSSRANHNRKGGAQWKRSRGMMPS